MLYAIDFETHPITHLQPAPKPIVLSWANEAGQSGLIVGMDEMERFLNTFLKSPIMKIIAHNLKFESAVIWEHFPNLREALWQAYQDERLFCTMTDAMTIANYIEIKNEKGRTIKPKFGLADLVKYYFAEDISDGKKGADSWRLRYNELEDVPLEQWPTEAKDYAIMDSVWALRAHKHHLKIRHDIHSYDSTVVDFILALSANRGFEIDPNRVKTLASEMRDVTRPIEKSLLDLGFGQIKKDGKFGMLMKKFREALDEHVDNIRISKAGTIQTKAEYLREYTTTNEMVQKTIHLILERSKYEKMLTAFIPSLETAVKLKTPMRTNYKPVITTNRTSSFGSKLYPSMNIQQMPGQVEGTTYDVRGCFKARKGFRIVSIDYGGLELCATAHQTGELFGESVMRDRLNEGSEPIDIHSWFAAKVYSKHIGRHISYEEFKNGLKTNKDYKFFRKICKALNLGFPGGIGYVVMATQLAQRGIYLKKFTICGDDGKRIAVDNEKQAFFMLRKLRAKDENIRVEEVLKRDKSDTEFIFIWDELVGLKNRWLEAFPEMRKFLKETHKDFLTGATKWKPDGFGGFKEEPLYSFTTAGIHRNHATYTEACNAYLMQTPSAVGAKRMLRKFGEKYLFNDNVHLGAFIHDEIIVEVRDDEHFEDNVRDICDLMIDGMQEILPSVRIQVEASGMKYWSKDGDGSFEKLYWKDPGNKELKYKL